MATTTISQAELARVSGDAYESKSYRISLGNNGTSGLTAESTTSDWDGVKLSGNGYADVTGTISSGSYNTTTQRYEMPQLEATFTASGGSLTYDTVYVVIDSHTSVHSISVESPAITLADGSSVLYRLTLAADD
tara:strand:- start:3934 stop:4335 length:402 start_codon:yes stop_codon:yes gene_type:complete